MELFECINIGRRPLQWIVITLAGLLIFSACQQAAGPTAVPAVTSFVATETAEPTAALTLIPQTAIPTISPALATSTPGSPAGKTAYADVIYVQAVQTAENTWTFHVTIDGPIAAPTLQHFGSGYDGSLANIHATSVQDALNRLESFCLMANLGLGLTEIRQLIASSIQLITMQERLPNGSRKLVAIVELRGLKDGRYVLQPLMRYNRENEQFEFTDTNPSWTQ